MDEGEMASNSKSLRRINSTTCADFSLTVSLSSTLFHKASRRLSASTSPSSSSSAPKPYIDVDEIVCRRATFPQKEHKRNRAMLPSGVPRNNSEDLGFVACFVGCEIK